MPEGIYKIAETFHSSQSEGSQAGQAAFFIRFHGCNLTCDFGNGFKCDDLIHSKPDYDSLTLFNLDILARKIKDTKNIIVTGGEATLDKNLPDLITGLQGLGYHVAVETNGQFIERAIDADLITYSPKEKGRWIPYTEYITMEAGKMPNIELKLLGGVNNPVNKYWEDYPLKYLQAINHQDSLSSVNTRWVADFVRENPDWYQSFQIHKFTGVE